jgi:hypothetical protein
MSQEYAKNITLSDEPFENYNLLLLRRGGLRTHLSTSGLNC